jgi:hypothetical protein
MSVGVGGVVVGASGEGAKEVILLKAGGADVDACVPAARGGIRLKDEVGGGGGKQGDHHLLLGPGVCLLCSTDDTSCRCGCCPHTT